MRCIMLLFEKIPGKFVRFGAIINREHMSDLFLCFDHTYVDSFIDNAVLFLIVSEVREDQVEECKQEKCFIHITH